MSKYTVLPVGHNNNRFTRPVEDPAPEVILSGPRPAVVHLVDINSWFACVFVDDQWFVGADAFSSSEEALAVATARARAREHDGGG